MRTHARAQKTAAVKRPIRQFPANITGWVLIGVTVVTVAFCLAASAKNILEGQVKLDPNRTHSTTPTQRPQSTQSHNSGSNEQARLVDKYGAVANSPLVSAAIRNAEASAGGDKLRVATGALDATSKYEALDHGYLPAGTDQTTALMYGFVPAGMAPEQAAMLSKMLPKMPRSVGLGLITPCEADRLAGVPADPTDNLPLGATRRDADAANRQLLESNIRARFGPVYLPQLHRDHQVSLIQPEYSSGGAPASIREMTNSSGSIVAQFGYDPFGRQTTIATTGVTPDFGYAGYYTHQRSGLILAVHRAYAPSTMFPNSNLSFC